MRSPVRSRFVTSACRCDSTGHWDPCATTAPAIATHHTAAHRGFEPRLDGPEPPVLPVTPTGKGSSSGFPLPPLSSIAPAPAGLCRASSSVVLPTPTTRCPAPDPEASLWMVCTWCAAHIEADSTTPRLHGGADGAKAGRLFQIPWIRRAAVVLVIRLAGRSWTATEAASAPVGQVVTDVPTDRPCPTLRRSGHPSPPEAVAGSAGSALGVGAPAVAHLVVPTAAQQVVKHVERPVAPPACARCRWRAGRPGWR